MEETISYVEDAVTDLSGFKKWEIPETVCSLAPREYSTALLAREKDWIARDSERTRNVVGPKDIKSCQHQHVNVCRFAVPSGRQCLFE